ncbi:hypothetical protein [Shimia sp. Alg240-R146]|uniref:hypothetical protein n=1 Tax=Shimia sp. Alg240-R146 TaxID=2993449 RepID=UPI0022E189E6|nr:hypothetical protein [Shimia sp. Alg240-R146]
MKYILATLLYLCFASVGLAEMPRVETASVQVKGAAKIVFAKGGCWPPANNSVRNFFGRRTFTLKDADIGKCGGDDKPKSSYSPPAPYLERVEVSGISQQLGGRYLFSTFVHFDPKFASADQTTFFTIHQWDSKTCRCAPFVRLVLDELGDLYALVLKRPSKPEAFRLGTWGRKDFETKWVEVAVDLDTSAKQSVSIYVGGKHELTTGVLVREGANVFPKFGLLRPGRTGLPLPTDRVHFTGARVSRLKQ